MKYIVLSVAFFMFLIQTINAQTPSNISQPLSINSTGADPDTSAMLDVQSTKKGVLVPRMSSASRMAISSPARGLVVYDSTLNTLCHYTGASWNCILPPTCATLDMAYDCGGPGGGRTIAVDSGAVDLVGTALTTSTLEVSAISMPSAVVVDQSGDGEVANFTQLNTLSVSDAVRIQHDGLGRAGFFATSDPGNLTATLYAEQLGIGNTGSFESPNPTNGSSVLLSNQHGTGSAGEFNSHNPMAVAPTLIVNQFGSGYAGHFSTYDPTNTLNTVQVDQFGMGHAGHFESHDPGAPVETVYAINNGKSDGVHGVATDSVYTVAGVVGTGMGHRSNASAFNAHDGQIRVTKTTSPNTPAEKIPLTLTSWLPMEDCPGSTGAGGDLQAWNSDIITIPNVYADPARSIILLTTESAVIGYNVQLIGIAPGSFTVQFVFTTDLVTGLCFPPPQVVLHYLIINL